MISHDRKQAEMAKAQQAQQVGHTPGPWTTGPTIYRGMAAEIRQGEDGQAIAQLWRQPACYADAHLIAAAPELLAVLQDLEWLGLNDGRGVTHRQCPACHALQSRGTGHNPHCGLAAAIAKAAGR